MGMRLLSAWLCLSLLPGAPALAAPAVEPAASLTSQDEHIRIRDGETGRKGAPVIAHDRRAVQGGGIAEGVKLETLIWGGGGAIIGSIAGPVGTIAGGAVGFLVGLTIGIVMPRKQAAQKFRG